MLFIKEILQGMVIGLANIIPGVSGGTMMVAMGVYDKLIHAITHIKSEFKKALQLLIPIVIGMGLAIVILSRLVEYLLGAFPIPTNFAFCGLIMGSLPFILNKIKGKPVTVGKIIPLVIFFAVVIVMGVMSATDSASADVTFGLLNVVKLFFVGVVAAATMIIPGVSGSMMLMLMGYYDVILGTINGLVDALVGRDMAGILTAFGVLVPFGIGVLVGIVVIAKLVEWVFEKAEAYAYYAITGLIVASPIVILMNTDWSGFSVIALLIGVVTFVAGWFVAGKLGGE